MFNLNNLTDDELMKLIRDKKKNNDEQGAWKAFTVIYLKYKEPLLRICRKHFGGRAEADMTYERTWNKIWTYPKFDSKVHKVKFLTWMSTIAWRVANDIRKVMLKGGALPDWDSVDVEEEKYKENPLTIPQQKLENAMATISVKECDILFTYLENDTGDNKHLQQNVIDRLKDKYNLSSAGLRQIKKRTLEKIQKLCR